MTFRDSYPGDTAPSPPTRLDLMTYEDRVSIPTPEGVELELVLAGIGSRMVGAMVDLLIKMVVLLALWLVTGAVASDSGGWKDTLDGRTVTATRVPGRAWAR